MDYTKGRKRNSNLEWKKHDEVIGNSLIYLPSNYEEIIVECRSTTDFVSGVTIHLCKIQLDTEYQYYKAGWCSTSDFYGELIFCIRVDVMYLHGATINGQNDGAQCITTVYYR